ncbi:MAG: universal stress protein [Micromonosporaceae bacterium]|jgi:nucleotide-binding universal stress UspA family protein|nr:universal stress protein [Micromonosporaceae bacterium]
MSRPVVVGVDGSASALGAVRLAVREAAYRRLPLRVVHAFIWPLMRVPLGPSPIGPPEGGLRREADRIVAEAVREAARQDAGVAVTGAVVTGAPAPVLVEESRQAAMVVLGTRGLGGFTGLLVGSVAVQVSAHAACPVLVSRHADGPGPVVVGVDGSPASGLAVDLAMAEASFRGATLLAVHAWARPAPIRPGDVPPPERDGAEATQVLAEAVAGRRDRYPDLKVDLRVVRGHPGHALITASAGAQLVVVGTRGRGGLAGLLLGSVSHAVLHHAGCPVMLVRPDAALGTLLTPQ